VAGPPRHTTEHTRVHLCALMYIYIYICVCVCVCVCACVCVCVREVHTHTFGVRVQAGQGCKRPHINAAHGPS